MTPSRPRYHERAFLRQSDLEQEQQHRIDARQRHNLGGHGWGIVVGLDITTDTELAVQPGYAIDGYGRELIVPERILIPDDTFTDLGPDVEVIDVWLVYFCEPIVLRQQGRNPADQSVRWREEARLRVEATTADRPLDPRRPAMVPANDYDLGPWRLPPHDTHAVWPVFLGRIARNTDPTLSYIQIALPRPYVTLHGELIASPPGRRDPELNANKPPAGVPQAQQRPEGARIQVGAELTTDRRRFAVSLLDTKGTYIDRLTINRDGSAEFGGPATLHNSLKLFSALLRPEDILDAPGLASALLSRKDAVSRYIADFPPSWTILDKRKSRFWAPSALQNVLLARLNKLLQKVNFYNAWRFSGVSLRKATRAALLRRKGADIVSVNRLLLEDAYPNFIARRIDEDSDSGSIQFRPLDEPPNTAAPWQISYVKTTKDKLETHTLRFEISNPGKQGDPGRNLFTIGHADYDRFVAGLAVAATGMVTVYDLAIENGQLVEQPIMANPSDPRFGEKLIEGLQQGLALDMNLQFNLSSVQSTAAPNSELIYTIKLTNTATVKFTNIVVYATQIVSGVVRYQNQQLAVVPPALDPGDEGDVAAGVLTLTVPDDPGHDIQIILVAIGVVEPAGRGFGSASKSTRITP